MVEVFTTNLFEPEAANKITRELDATLSAGSIHFDLEKSAPLAYPCTHSVMRVEGKTIEPREIIAVMKEAGFQCDIMEDKVCN